MGIHFWLVKVCNFEGGLLSLGLLVAWLCWMLLIDDGLIFRAVWKILIFMQSSIFLIQQCYILYASPIIWYEELHWDRCVFMEMKFSKNFWITECWFLFQSGFPRFLFFNWISCLLDLYFRSLKWDIEKEKGTPAGHICKSFLTETHRSRKLVYSLEFVKNYPSVSKLSLY